MGEQFMTLPKNSILPVSGVSFEKENVQKVKEGDLVRLVCEPDNPYDKNAVAVFVQNVGKVGYIPKKLAERMNPTPQNVSATIREGVIVHCLSHKNGDGETEQVGLRIRLTN